MGYAIILTDFLWNNISILVQILQKYIPHFQLLANL